MTAMKRCRECWVDWQRFQDNESDMFKNNDTRQTHGAAQDTVVGSLSCWRHAKNSFCKSCEAESSVFFQLGLDAPLGAGFAIFVAAICPTWREKLWAFRVPFLGAYFVPVFGAGHIDARSRGSFFGPAIRTPIQGQKQSSERASWPAF